MNDLGFTHIHEHVRQHFGISRDEYALCNYIQTWAAHPKNARPGWCNRTQKQMADFIGITDRGLRKMLLKMVALALVTKDPLTAHHRISTVWFEMVTSAKEEQSSGSEPKQMRNKVPNDAEQSSSFMRNKVPTHNKYNKESIVSNNVSEKNADGPTLLVTTYEAVTVPLEATPLREEKPSPTVPAAAKPKPAKPCANLEDCYKHFSDPAAIRKTFEDWLAYKRQMKHGYKLESTKITALRNLYKWTAGNVDLAAQIVSNSIDNEYRGLFEPKKQNPITPNTYGQPYRLEPPLASTHQPAIVD